MRFFHYSAIDSAGRPAEGTIRAASKDAAIAALRQSGYKINALGDAPAPTPAPTSPRPVSATRAVVATMPAPVRATAVEGRSQTPAAPDPSPAMPAPAATVKTRFGKDRDLFFLFSQMGNLFRAGVTPVQAFHDLANRAPARYRDSLNEMAKRTGETGRMSEVMASYPYLYPPDVVGTVRAGEAAGALPEAMQRIADHMHSSHRFKRRLGWIFAYFLIMVGMVPVIYGILMGSLGSIAAQNEVDGNLPVVPTLKAHVASEVSHLIPLVLVVWVVGAALIYGWNTMPLRGLRHRIALRFPIMGKRIWAESLSRFTWACTLLSRGGMPPQRVFELAAESIPNLEVRERMLDASRTMGETERLSGAIRRTGLMPVEYASIVETGEITGDVPRALEQVGRAADVEFDGRDRGATKGMTIILILAIGSVVLIILAIFYRLYFGGMITILTQDPT